MYVHESIPFKLVLTHRISELLFLELNLNKCNLLCALVYRPPSANSSVLLHLEESLDALPPAKSQSLLLLGDFNINLSNDPNSPQLSSIQAKHALRQIILHPTRTTSSSSTIIDHVYLSHPLNQTHQLLPPVSSSDHCSILISLTSIFTRPSKICKRKIWIYQSGDFDSANKILANQTCDCSSDLR